MAVNFLLSKGIFHRCHQFEAQYVILYGGVGLLQRQYGANKFAEERSARLGHDGFPFVE